VAGFEVTGDTLGERKPMKQTKPRSAAWGTSYDKYGDPSGEFTASREGLVYLRAKIDEALAGC